MALIPSRSSSTWIFSTKLILASMGVVATAVMLRFSAPSIQRLVSSEVPKIYGSLLSWLTPPYLYFVINFIIISIAVSSRFQKPAVKERDQPDSSSPAMTRPEFVAPAIYDAAVEVAKPEVTEEYGRADVAVLDGEEFVVSPKRRGLIEIPTEYSILTEKPTVSVRFGHRRGVKSSSEGRVLSVARPKRNETLESTWRTITDGRAMPLARHLKKSDTWDSHVRPRDPSPVRKSETFNDAGRSAGRSGRLRKEPSMGQDDLNGRVEAFINKFNEEMRLQRQESLKHYWEMINRGSQ